MHERSAFVGYTYPGIRKFDPVYAFNSPTDLADYANKYVLFCGTCEICGKSICVIIKGFYPLLFPQSFLFEDTEQSSC